jgi:iron complex outermembrane receptor protein
MATPLLPQEPVLKARLGGTLTDPTGAVLTGAVVSIHEAGTSRSWNIPTDSHGRFALAGLPPGSYNLSIRQNGFSEILERISLAPGESADRSLVLSISSVVQQVDVSGGPTSDGITSRQIREGSARDLGEATEDIAGVEKVRKAAIANDIAIRGLIHSNLGVSFDGVRMYGACTSQMDPAIYHVDLSEVDHIDIVKGPFDVTTQGAMGGFVKVITKTPDTDGVHIHSNISTGSYGYYNPSATMQMGSASIHSLVGYSYRTSEFYRDGNGKRVSDLAPYRNGDQNLQAFRTFSAWTKLALEPLPNQRAEVAYTRQQSGDLLYPYMIMDGIFDDADRFSVRYDDLQRKGWMRGLHGLIYLDKINHLMDNSLRSSAGSLPASMRTQVVSFTDGVRFVADLAHDTSVGYEFHRRYWNSNGFMMMSMMGMPTMTSVRTLPGVVDDIHGTYITYRRAFGDRVLLTAGARYDHSHTDASKGNPAFYQAYHSTKATSATDSGLSGNFRLSCQATPKLSLFTGVGSNIRFPDPEEQFFQSNASMISGAAMNIGWVGNPLLTHPRDTEYDLGFSTKGNRLFINPLIFFSSLDNDISLYSANRIEAAPGVTSTTAQSYANVQAYEWGGELTAGAPLGGGLRTFGTLSWTRGTKVPQPSNNIVSSNLFQIPPVRAQVDLRYERQGLHAAATSIVTGRQDHVDTDEMELPTAGYSVFNLKLGYRTARFSVEGGVNNLLNREYSDFLSYARNPYNNGIRLPEPGRNFFLNASYTFGHSKR